MVRAWEGTQTVNRESEYAVTEEKEQSTVVHGRVIELPSGAKVWGGLQDRRVVWRFTSSEGGITTLSLSDHAMHAVIQIYQGLIGCDEDFARVTVERAEDPTPGAT